MAPKYLVRNVKIIIVVGVLTIPVFLYLYIDQTIAPVGRMWRAEAEISSMETALTAVLADAGFRDFRSLCDKAELERIREAEMARTGDDAFTVSVRIFSEITPILLKHGKETREVLESSEDTAYLRDLIPDYQLRLLGEGYMDYVSFIDPWGTPYQFYFGHWPSDLGPIPLRTYVDGSPGAKTDKLTVANPAGASLPAQIGFPPPPDIPYYIWSFGRNRQSDQAVFDASGKYAGPPSKHYRPNATPAYRGGGDDVTNWDKHRSYDHFYQ